MAKAGKGATRHQELAGAPPQMATVQDLQGANEPLTGNGHARQRSASTKGAGRHKINLRAVSEALIEEGLDPAAEIIRILKAKVPLTTRGGAPVVDAQGKPVMVDAIDADTKLRTLNEMLQYTQPKLKAVEMKVSGHLDLSEEQLDQRLAALLARAAK